MKKDFQGWHYKKCAIDLVDQRPNFHAREIWYSQIGLNVGYEQDGAGRDYLRPVIVYRKFNNEIFWAIPLTRTAKESPFYFQFVLDGNISSAILSQVRMVDAKRLSHKIGDISEKDFENLNKKFKALLP